MKVICKRIEPQTAGTLTISVTQRHGTTEPKPHPYFVPP